MYQVSEKYIDAMMEPSVRRRITGTIGDIPFNDSDIEKDSFSITNSCATESDFKIGGVYMGQLDMRFVPSFLNTVPRNMYQGKDVTIYIGLYVDEDEEWVDIPCGVFTLQAPKISKEGVSVTGYDYMAKFDKTFSASTIAGDIVSMLRVICMDCGVELGMTDEEIQALPNGTEMLSMYSENDVETYRDLLYWIAQTTGRFATIDREGRLVLRKFGVHTGFELDEMHRDIDIVFSGYTTHYTGISMVNMETGELKYYGLDPDDGLTMNMGQNPLLQYGLDETVDRQRIAILNEVADIEYTPFSFTSIRDCIFDLGDEIQFTGGISNNCMGCVMSITLNLDSYSFAGYGDDPALATARNKTDKNISGLLSKTESGVVTYYSYTNIDEIVIPDSLETEIGSIRFAAKKMTDVVVQCEIKLNVDNTAEADRTIVYHDEIIPDDPETPEDEGEVVPTEIGYFDKVERPMIAHIYYYYDGELIDYQPIETWSEEGYHVFSGFYHLKDITIDQMHDFVVKMRLTGANGEVSIGDSHILISGQGLASDKDMKGEITADDKIPLYSIRRFSVKPITESVTIEINETDVMTIQEEVPKENIRTLSTVGVEDHEPSIILRNVVFGFITDDGDDIMTEGKDYYITTDLDET